MTVGYKYGEYKSILFPKLPAQPGSSLPLCAWRTTCCSGAPAQLEAQAAPQAQSEPFTKPEVYFCSQPIHITLILSLHSASLPLYSIFCIIISLISRTKLWAVPYTVGIIKYLLSLFGYINQLLRSKRESRKIYWNAHVQLERKNGKPHIPT